MSLLATSADVTKIKDKDPLSGTNEVNGDVMERCFFHADCLRMAPGQMACCHLAIAYMCDVICFLLVWVHDAQACCTPCM